MCFPTLSSAINIFWDLSCVMSSWPISRPFLPLRCLAEPYKARYYMFLFIWNNLSVSCFHDQESGDIRLFFKSHLHILLFVFDDISPSIGRGASAVIKLLFIGTGFIWFNLMEMSKPAPAILYLSPTQKMVWLDVLDVARASKPIFFPRLLFKSLFKLFCDVMITLARFDLLKMSLSIVI